MIQNRDQNKKGTPITRPQHFSSIIGCDHNHLFQAKI